MQSKMQNTTMKANQCVLPNCDFVRRIVVDGVEYWEQGGFEGCCPFTGGEQAIPAHWSRIDRDSNEYDRACWQGGRFTTWSDHETGVVG